MVISSTSMVAVSIHAVSPLSALATAACAKALAGASTREARKAVLGKRIGIDLLGADTDGLLEFQHEDLAVADLPRARGLGDRLDGAFELFLGHGQLHLELGPG